jgi:hypothetical protein
MDKSWTTNWPPAVSQVDWKFDEVAAKSYEQEKVLPSIVQVEGSVNIRVPFKNSWIVDATLVSISTIIVSFRHSSLVAASEDETRSEQMVARAKKVLMGERNNIIVEVNVIFLVSEFTSPY